MPRRLYTHRYRLLATFLVIALLIEAWLLTTALPTEPDAIAATAFPVVPAVALHPDIQVVETVTGAGDVALRQAIAFDGRYTTSHIRIVRACAAGHYCIHVRYGNPDAHVPKGYYAIATTTYQTGGAVITINRHLSLTASAKRRMYEHELGHALGIYAHNPKCTSVMYFSLTCTKHGHLSPERFTPAERAILRRR